MNKSIILIFTFISLLAGQLWAQSSESRDVITAVDDANDATLSRLKDHINALLQENRRLSTQYHALQSRLSELQTAVVIRKSELEQSQDNKIKKDLDVRQIPLPALQEKITATQNELLVEQSRHALLSGKVLDGDEKLKLLKVQLADLQFKRRQNDLESRVRQFVDEEGQKREEREVLILKNELEKKQEQTKAKEEQIEHLRAQADQDELNVAHKIEKMQNDKGLLQQQLNDLTKVVGLKRQQVAYLKDKLDYAQKSYAFERQQRIDDTNQLKAKVAALKDEYETIDKNLDVSLNGRQQKKQLMQSLIDIDKENQSLRDRIASLQDKINSLQN